MGRLSEAHENQLRRLSDSHREKIALLDRQFLQQKQQLMRQREAAIWEMEERQLHERHQLAKRQLKDLFFLQRHQMLASPQNLCQKCLCGPPNLASVIHSNLIVMFHRFITKRNWNT